MREGCGVGVGFCSRDFGEEGNGALGSLIRRLVWFYWVSLFGG